MRRSHELLTSHRSDPGRVDAQPIPVPNALRNQLHSATGPHQLAGRWSKSEKTSPENHVLYFVMPGNHNPLLALGANPRPFVGLYVGLSGTVARRPLEPPARCAWLEPATQNEGNRGCHGILARQTHELLTNHSPDPGSADAQPIPVPNTLENQLHSVTGPHQLGGRRWKSAKVVPNTVSCTL